MRRYLFLTCALAALACPLAHADQPAATLNFFVVYTQPGTGLHLYDTKQFPRLGYIADKPDLVWTELAGAKPSTETIQDAKLGPNGKLIPTGTHTEPVISLTLTPSETQQFFQLTTLYKGKKTLVLLGETPLIAPMIDGPINTSSIMISGKVPDPAKFSQQLQVLVKKGSPGSTPAPVPAQPPTNTPAAKTP